MAGICTSPYSFLYPIKKVGDSHIHILSQCGDSIVKTKTGSENTHEDGFICHL